MLEWIEQGRADDQPFFGYLAYTAPHDPLHAPKEYIDKYKGTYDQGWDALRQERLQTLKKLGMVPKDAVPFPRLPTVKAWDALSLEERKLAARDMEVYAAMVDYLDEQIKRVFDYLKEIGEYDNTMILFISDNGANGSLPTAYPGQTEDYLGSFDNSLDNRGLPGSFIEMGPGWAQASMSPSRMFKAYTTEGGIKAPLLVKVPGKPVEPGAVNHSFVHVRDIMPTLLDVAGAAKPDAIDGRKVLPMQGQSVLDLFAGKSETAYAGASRVGYELFSFKAFFDGNWKIVWLPKPGSSSTSPTIRPSSTTSAPSSPTSSNRWLLFGTSTKRITACSTSSPTSRSEEHPNDDCDLRVTRSVPHLAWCGASDGRRTS
jgi:arylsulfatase